MVLISEIESEFNKIFKEAETCQDDQYKNVLSQINSLFNQLKTPFDFKKFNNIFINNNLLNVLESQESDKVVERILKFVASYAVTLTENDIPFFRKIINFTCKRHSKRNEEFKSRLCLLLNLILTKMGSDAWLGGDICKRITDAMLVKLEDNSALVRLHAVQALCRMQEPDNDNCEVINAYIDHLSHDPSPEVRIKIIDNIGECQKTVDAMCHRTIEDDKEVRKKAYLYLSKVSATALKLKDRQDVLRDGLQESEQIAEIVSETLLPAWLTDHTNNILDFLKVLDVKSDVECAVIVINTLFKQINLKTLLKQLPLDLKTKTIPIDKLTCENVLFWRCLIQHLQKSSHIELLHPIVPNLTNLSGYIEDFENQASDNMQDSINEPSPHLFILCQLFEILKLNDSSDNESTKKKLKPIVEKIILNKNINRIYLTEFMLENYATIFVDTKLKIEDLSKTIRCTNVLPSVSFDHEQDQCLKETYQKLMLTCLGMNHQSSPSAQSPINSPGIKNLHRVDHDNEHVKLLSHLAIGSHLLLDKDLAKSHIELFFNVFGTEKIFNADEWIMSLTIIFKLLAKYGLDHFGLVYVDDDAKVDSTAPLTLDNLKRINNSSNNIIEFLLDLTYCEVALIQLAAAEGFCILLEAGIITGANILSRLILIYHVNKNTRDNSRQIVRWFFKKYLVKVKNSQEILKNSFCLSLNCILTASKKSPFHQLDPRIVAKFIFNILRQAFQVEKKFFTDKFIVKSLKNMKRTCDNADEMKIIGKIRTIISELNQCTQEKTEIEECESDNSWSIDDDNDDDASATMQNLNAGCADIPTDESSESDEEKISLKEREIRLMHINEKRKCNDRYHFRRVKKINRME